MSEWPGDFEVRKKPHYKAKRLGEKTEIIVPFNGHFISWQRGVVYNTEYRWFTSNGNIYEYTTK